MTVNPTQNTNVPPGRRSTQVRNPVDPTWLALPAWTHPEVQYWVSEWKLIRDAIAGEKAIKMEGINYLPKLSDMDQDEYAAYLERATYYNFTSRTQRGLTGTLFRRQPTIEGIPDDSIAALKEITRDAQSLRTLMKGAVDEMLALSRAGMLVDMPSEPTTQPNPYIVPYSAENILYWETRLINGRLRLTRVVLRELKLGNQNTSDDKPSPDVQSLSATQPKNKIASHTDRTYTNIRRYFARYRELVLVPKPDDKVPNSIKWTYIQRLFEKDNGDAIYGTVNADGSIIIPAPETPNQQQGTVSTWTEIVPTLRGQTLDFIPFRFLSPNGSNPTVMKPVLGDIARLNISHYRSYAHLEHGRFFTGFPIYFIEMGQQGESGDYRIGSARVWESPMGSKPGVLEFHGTGLKSLTEALDQKENQAASLGGRMLGVRGQGTGESNNQSKLKERNEQAVLLEIAVAMDEGFSQLLAWWLMFRGETEEVAKNAEVTFSKDFLFDEGGAREFRAIQSMYLDGVIPIEIVYEYLRKSNVIPDWMQVDEFKELLDNPKSFPNQPDAEARAKGFPDMKTELAYEEPDANTVEITEGKSDDVETLTTSQEDIAEADRTSKEKQVKTTAAAAKVAAKNAPPAPGNTPPGVPPGKSQANPAAAKPAAKRGPIRPIKGPK